MKPFNLILTILALFTVNHLFAQNQDSIYIKRNWATGYKLYNGKDIVSLRKIKRTFRDDVEINQQIKAIRINRGLGTLNAIACGVSTGIGISQVFLKTNKLSGTLLLGGGTVFFLNILLLEKEKANHFKSLSDKLNKMDKNKRNQLN